MNRQADLFLSVTHAYADGQPLDNAGMYAKALNQAGIPLSDLNEKVPVGQSQKACSLLARQLRWYQQTLKHAGIIERVENGIWQLTAPAGEDLSRVNPQVAVLGFSTDLGIAILGSCDTVFSRLDTPIHLVITSPPYPLARARKYGNPTEPEYVDWICRTIEPVVKNLVPGGSICLNVSNDIFMPGLPARSLYRERLIIALHERLGLYKMDEIVWHNPSKAPAPVQWASKERVQLNVAWEPVYWLTNDPSRVRSDNRRALQEHTDKHLKYIQAGGETRLERYSDGAYSLRPGKFSNLTAGRIHRNVVAIGHSCADQRLYKHNARAAGLPVHGAAMPLKLADFFIRLLSEPEELVVDPFGGSFTTARAAESLGRRWISTDNMLEYVLGGALRFQDTHGFNQNLRAA